MRTIFTIILFSLFSLFSLPGKVCADGVVGTILELLEKSRNSNSPTVTKNKKDSKVKSASKDSSKKNGVVSPISDLVVDGCGVFRFGMGMDEVKKIASCHLEAVLGEMFIHGGEVFVCGDFSFDGQSAEARFAFVDGVLQGLRISIPFDKKRLESLPKKYASRYGAPTRVSTNSEIEAWEKGAPDAEIGVQYSNGIVVLVFTNNESGVHDAIFIAYNSEKLTRLLEEEDARAAKKEEAAVKLSADFDVVPTTGTCPLEAHFKDKSVGRVMGGCWDFGDGEKSKEQNPTHIYKKSGTYTVKLTVGNETAKDEAVKVVQVLAEKLAASFVSLPIRGIAPLEVQFTDSSRGNPEKWHWDFGDGSGSDHASLAYIYNEPGTYTAKLTVSNKTAEAIAEREIVVCPGDANFTVNDYTYCFSSGDQIQFMDVSTGRPIMWNWDFGDGKRSDDQNPVHVYTKEGRYTITLAATYAGGRISIKKRPDYVVVVPEKFWINTGNSLFGVLRDTTSVRSFLSAIFPKGILDEPMLNKIIHKQVSYRDMTTTAMSNLYKDADLLYNIHNRSDRYILLLDSKRLCLGILGAAQLTYDKVKSQNPRVTKSYIYNSFTGSDDGARVLESLEEELLVVSKKISPEYYKETVISYGGVCCDREHQVVYYTYGLTRAAAENKLDWGGRMPSSRAIYNFALEYAEDELGKCKCLLGKASGGGECDSYKNECACIEGAIKLLKKTSYKDMWRILLEANGGSLTSFKTEEGNIVIVTPQDKYPQP